MRRRRSSSSTKDCGKHSAQEILNAFQSVRPEKSVFGNFRLEDNTLIYRAQSSKKISGWSDEQDFKERVKEIGQTIREIDGWLVNSEGKKILVEALTKSSPSNDLKVQYFETNIIAKKIETKSGLVCFGNSDALNLIGRVVAYGNCKENSGDTEIQQAMRAEGFVMLPMAGFEHDDFSTYESIEKGTPSTHNIKLPDHYHNNAATTKRITFGGAHLFKLEGDCYLYDIDRRECQYSNINPFLVKLPKNNVSSIREAYETLKPQAVIDAELAGKSVKRLGRCFFIGCNTPTLPILTIDEKLYLLASQDRLEDQILKHLVGYACTEQSEVNMLLHKIPRRMDLNEFIDGRRVQVETFIQLNNHKDVYCTGDITSEGRTTLTLQSWYLMVEALGQSIKTALAVGE